MAPPRTGFPARLGAVAALAGVIWRAPLQKLIAASPELLAFAQRMAEYFDENPNGYDDMREHDGHGSEAQGGSQINSE